MQVIDLILYAQSSAILISRLNYRVSRTRQNLPSADSTPNYSNIKASSCSSSLHHSSFFCPFPLPYPSRLRSQFQRLVSKKEAPLHPVMGPVHSSHALACTPLVVHPKAKPVLENIAVFVPKYAEHIMSVISIKSMVDPDPRAAAVMEQARHVLHVGQLSAQMFLSNAPTTVKDTSWVEAVDYLKSSLFFLI